MVYQNFGLKEVDIKNTNEVINLYNQGYVFTRVGTGQMQQVRSLRIDLELFEASSENRRILRKYNHNLIVNTIPYPDYTWQIHKMGKDFYDTKFGAGIFSANKIHELFTTQGSNFNQILTFVDLETSKADGYCIAYSGDNTVFHYAYPFYELELINSSFGIYMMTKAVQTLKELNYKYIYLGSVHNQKSLYKLQFKGLEWWDEQKSTWCADIGLLKHRVTDYPIGD